MQIDTKRLPPIGPPGMPEKVVEVIKNGLGFNTYQHSAAELLNTFRTDFISKFVSPLCSSYSLCAIFMLSSK